MGSKTQNTQNVNNKSRLQRPHGSFCIPLTRPDSRSVVTPGSESLPLLSLCLLHRFSDRWKEAVLCSFPGGPPTKPWTDHAHCAPEAPVGARFPAFLTPSQKGAQSRSASVSASPVPPVKGPAWGGQGKNAARRPHRAPAFQLPSALTSQHDWLVSK